MKELILSQNFIIYLLIINLIGFAIMFIDKEKAKRGSWRIPEKTIFIVTAIGGGIGTIAGMYKFRHKTKKLKFTFGMPAILAIEIAILIYLPFLLILDVALIICVYFM